MNKSLPQNFKVARLISLQSLLHDLDESSDAGSTFLAMEALKGESGNIQEEKISKHDIRLGCTPKEETLVPEGTVVSIPSKALNGNLSVSARIRTGKTYILMYILLQVAKLGIRFVVFERKKSFRPLIDLTEAILVEPQELKHNLFLAPSGVPFRSHLMKICQTFAATQMLTNVSEHVLYEIVMGNLAEFQKQNQGRFIDAFSVRICISEMIKKLHYKEQRMTNLYVGLADRWNALCTYLGEAFDDLAGIEQYDISQHANLIIDCSELSNPMIAFVYFEFLSRLSLGRLHSGLKESNAPLHLAVCDEFEDVLGQVNVGGNSLLIDYWRRDREANLGKMVVNHSADYHQRYDTQIITNTISSNTLYQIVGPMGNRDELNKLGRRLGFEQHHFEWLGGDGERRFVLTAPNHDPICFIADEVCLPESYDETGHELRKKELFASYESVPVPQHQKLYVMSEIFKKNFTPSRSMEAVRKEAKITLKKNAIHFLRLLAEDWTQSYSQLRSKFSSVQTAQDAKKYCLDNNLVQEAAIPNGNSRPSNHFHVTGDGRELLQSEGLLKSGEPLHRIKHHTFAAICAHLKALKLTELDFEVSYDEGDGIDLVLKDKSGRIVNGVEINYTTPVSRELYLVKKGVQRGIPDVCVVVLDFKEVMKNSFQMVEPTGKIKAFRDALDAEFQDVKQFVTIMNWQELLKWNPAQK